MSEQTAIIASPINPSGAPPTEPEQRGKARLHLVDVEAWLTRLTESADFQRFLAFVKEGADQTAEQAGNITSHTTEQGYALSQRFFGLKAMHEWPATQLAATRRLLAEMDKAG